MIIPHTPVALNQFRGEIKTSRRTDEAETEREKGRARQRAYLKMTAGKVSATIYPSCVDDE